MYIVHYLILISQLEAQLAYTEAQSHVRDMLWKIPLERIREPQIRRAIRFLSVIGIAALPRDQLDRVSTYNLE